MKKQAFHAAADSSFEYQLVAGDFNIPEVCWSPPSGPRRYAAFRFRLFARRRFAVCVLICQTTNRRRDHASRVATTGTCALFLPALKDEQQ
nr:unnamed protein product [Spirometra erinaceieuropaei]